MVKKSKKKKILNTKLILTYIIVFLLVDLFILLALLYNSNDKNIKYPIVFNTKDSMLFLGTEKSNKKGSVELTKKTTGQKVLYSNNSGRYVLYKDDMSLKMYDLRTNKKVDLLSKVNYYDFTLDDKKVVMTDLKKNLYYFSLKKKKGYLIDEKVDNVYTHSNSYVLYMKDNALYVARLNNKKTEISKITDNYVNNFKFNQKGDKVYFLNKDEQFIEYVIKDKKLNVIDEKVRAFYCKEDCDNYYYLTTTDNNTLKYYKDEKSNVIDNNVKEVSYSNDEEDQVVYTKENDTNYEMYYKEKKNDIVKIDNLNDIRDIQIYKNNYIYYINDANELKYAVVNKGQLKENKVLGNNVSGYLYLYKNGCFYVANVNDEQIGTLFTVKKDKVKEVDKEVSNNLLFINKDNNKVYYYKNYGSVGDLYVSNGKKNKLIDSNIYDFQYINDKFIYYLKDYNISAGYGTLYLYKNKAIKIASDVVSIVKR